MTPNKLVKKRMLQEAQKILSEAAISLGYATHKTRALARRRVLDAALNLFTQTMLSQGIKVKE